MSADQPFVGEIYMFAGNFAPVGWTFCNGSLLSIAEFTALFALLGTTYGGDGQTTFGLPDLRSRIPVHQGNGHIQGAQEGVETVTLLSTQIPVHTHQLAVSPNSSSLDAPAAGDLPGETALAGVRLYAAPASAAGMSPSAISPSGGGQPHQNVMPYLAVNFIISLFGIFPSRN
jgi:microcystin-dependent protein